MSRGRHRRPRNPLIPRQFSRLSLALTVGGAGIAIPLATAGTAHAAPAPASVQPVSVQPAVTAAAPQSGKAVQISRDDASYTVAAGDTLYGIATAHDVEGGWQALYEGNREAIGSNPNLIHPGQRLTLAGAPADRDAPGTERAQRSADRAAVQTAEAEPTAAKKSYPNNLDGWIREALDIMRAHGIPGTYEGIHRNIMRESSGNPNAINNWDINAQRGTPSIGLLQVIKPTFDAYHVPGTAYSQYDPVANIVAACNYAADRYGSIDNVNGPY